MKRHLIMISLVFLIVVGILLSLLAAMARDSGPEMSFDFLDGRALTGRINDDHGGSTYKTTCDIYSFVADLNDLCSAADAELASKGFKLLPPGPRWASEHVYLLGSIASVDCILLSIRDGRRFRVYSVPRQVRKSGHPGHSYHDVDGWVSVEISRRRIKCWPP